MQNKNVLLISGASGDPRNRKSWSGTPFNIVNSFESMGVSVLTFYFKINIFQKVLCKLHQRIFGLGVDINRGPLSRNIIAKSLNKFARKNRIEKILYMGTLDLPTSGNVDSFEHFLFCDSTWNIWSRYSTDIKKYTKKMVHIAEGLEKKAYGEIKHFFTISEYVRSNLIEHYKISQNKITVVGTGTGNIRPFYGEKDYENGYVLFVAKNRFKDKGGHLLLDGFKIALKRFPHLRLIIVGDEEYKKYLGGISNVIVKGHVSWEELENLFHNASLFAMPAAYEPWGLVYLEALSCRTPILGLNRCSLPEITQNGRFGFLVQEESPQGIAEALIEAFSDTSGLKKKGIYGQEYYKDKFSWDKTVKKIRNVILEY